MKQEIKSFIEGPASHFGNICRAIIEGAPLPMALLEEEGLIVRCVNPLFCRLLDKLEKDLLGAPVSEVLPGSKPLLESLARVLCTGLTESHTEYQPSLAPPDLVSYVIWPVGEGQRPLGVMIQITEGAPLAEGIVAMNEALLLGSVRQHELTEMAENLNSRLRLEIAERIQTEVALRQAQAQLADRAVQLEALVAARTAELTVTNRQLEDMVYSIAHDLRAPLRAMEGFSTLLAGEVGTRLNEKGKGYAARIGDSAQYLDALLGGLLAFSSIAQVQTELNPIDLGAVVDTVLARLEKEIEKTKAQVEKIGPWPVVTAYEPVLVQILFNLISNSLKFASPGFPPRVRLWAEERLGKSLEVATDRPRGQTASPVSNPAPTANSVRVWVEDQGIGIAADHQSQIFRLFARLHGDKYPGTGLGLALVRKGVESMGGRFGVESSPKEGSRFWFELRK